MSDNIVLKVDDDADEAAFEAGFSSGIEDAAKDKEPLAKQETVQVEEIQSEVPKTEELEVDPAPQEVAEPVKLFAGLTEEQLQAALARSGNLQSTVDKMAGRMGNLMQQLEALRTAPPTTQAAQVALDLKLEKLSGAFPQLAELLREDLQALQGVNAAAPPLAEATPSGFTQEQLDAMLAERLEAVKEETNSKLEEKILTVLHPDWREVVNSSTFALYKSNVLSPDASKALMESQNSEEIARGLTGYKTWLAQVTAKPAAQVTAKPSARLTNAVIPTKSGRASSNNEAVDADEAFLRGFEKERSRGGYA